MINNDDHLLLNHYINSVLFSGNKDESIKTNIELIVKPECNQQCEYCYITKYGSSLYPKEHRVNNETILKNVSMLLNHFLEKESYLQQMELFAGDLFFDNLFFDLIEIIYDYYLTIYKINPFLFEKDKAKIIIPCNFSFCESPAKIEQFKNVFKRLNDINVYLFLSYSSDGIYSVDIREKKTLSEEFIHNVFTLIYDCGYNIAHPMLSYEGIHNSIQNYEWWKNQFSKYNKIYGLNEKEHIIPCMLEVRNEGWTDDLINKYIELLDYMINDRIVLCNNDLDQLTFELFCRDAGNTTYPRIGPTCMDPIKIVYSDAKQNYNACTLGNAIAIQCNDLTLIPCHRLAYPFYHGGRFIIENNKVVGLQALNNLSGYLNLIHRNAFYAPGCATCDYQRICLKGCCGSQFESMSDPNIPIADVCKLLKTKTNFLIKRYAELGILEKAIKSNYLTEAEIETTFKILNLLGESHGE